MEDRELRDLVGEELESQLEGLSQLEIGSKEYTAAVEGLTKLYRLRIDETKNEWDYYEKQDRRTLEKELHDADEKLKRDQMAHETELHDADEKLKRDQMQHELKLQEREAELKKESEKREWLRWGIGLGAQVGMAIIGIISYGSMFNKGIKFEETGTFTSGMMKGLMSKMPNPWRK